MKNCKAFQLKSLQKEYFSMFIYNHFVDLHNIIIIKCTLSVGNIEQISVFFFE